LAQLDPNYPDLKEWRAYSAYVTVSNGWDLCNHGHLADGLKVIDLSAALDPTYPDPYFAKRRIFFVDHKLDESLINLKKAIAIDSHYEQAYLLMDQIYSQRKEWDNVITNMNTYIALEPKKPFGYSARARAYQSKNDLQSAKPDFKMACSLG